MRQNEREYLELRFHLKSLETRYNLLNEEN